MPTSKPEVPNSAPGGDDPSSYKAKIDAGFNAQARLGWAWAPYAQDTPNMTVALAAGQLLEGTTLTEVAAQSTGTITAPVTHPRIDRVVIDRATGAASVVAGTEAASPAAPAIPTGKLPVARVALAVGQTAIVNANIADERVGGGAGVTIGTIADPSETEVPSTQDVAETIAAIPREDTTARDNAAMTALLAWLSAGRSSGPVPGGGLYTLKTDELTNSGGTYDAAGDYYSNQTGGGGLSAPNNLTADGMSSFAAAFANATYAPWKAFNGTDKSTAIAGWQSPNDGQVVGKYIGRHFGATGHVVRRILIWNSQYSSGWRNGVKDFWVEGSNDAVPNGAGGLSTVGTWTKIPVVAVNGGGVVVYPDTARINQEAGDGVAPTAELILGGNTVYKAVRLGFVSASWGGGSPDYAHIREIEMYDTLTVTDMTLTSAGVALGHVPGKASLYLLHKAVDALTLNTDIKVSASRGDGWAEATDLAVLCQYDADYKLLRASVDLSALAPGSTAYWRVQTFNTKAQQVRGALLWAE